ncbi:MAG: hypothetical protein LBM77_03685 [Spirochaetaceae bacterium]|nr:hypothetical protein [Spirochaetaceae bacterium]
MSCWTGLEAPDVGNGVEVIIGYNPDDTVALSASRTVTPIGFQDDLDYLIRFQNGDDSSENHYFTISQGSIRRRVVLDPGNYKIDVVGFVGGTISGGSAILTGDTTGTAAAEFSDWVTPSSSEGVFTQDSARPIPADWITGQVNEAIVVVGQTISSAGTYTNEVVIPRGDIIRITVPLVGYIYGENGTLDYKITLPGDMTGKNTAGGDENTYDEAWLEWTANEMIDASNGETNIYNANGLDASYTGITALADLVTWADGHQSSVSSDALYLITSGLLGYRWDGAGYTATDFVPAYKKVNFLAPANPPATGTSPSSPLAAEEDLAPGFYTVSATVIKRISEEDAKKAIRSDTLHIYQATTTYLDWVFTDDMLANAPGGIVTVQYNDAGDDLFDTDLVTLYKDWDDENDAYDWTSPLETVSIDWNDAGWEKHGFDSYNLRIEIDGENYSNANPPFESKLVGGTTISASTGFTFDVRDFQVGNHTFTLIAKNNNSPNIVWSKTITVRSERGPGLWQENKLIKKYYTSSSLQTNPAPTPTEIASNSSFIKDALVHIRYAGATANTNWYINFSGNQTINEPLTNSSGFAVNQNITLSGIAATENNVYVASWPAIILDGAASSLASLGNGQHLTITGQTDIRGNTNTTRMLTVGNANASLVLGGNVRISGHSGGALSVTAGTLVMNDLVNITGNTASTRGVGVSVSGGSFTMNGGIISNNNATATGVSGGGGGVYVGATATRFAKNGGIIYGEEADEALSNKIQYDAIGAALNYNNSSATRYRNKTIGYGDKLLYIGGSPTADDGWTSTGGGLWNLDPAD